MQEIIKQLSADNQFFPAEAVRQAEKHKGEITPLLLDELQEMFNKEEEYDKNLLSLYVFFLLAKFREKKAFPLLMNFLQLPEDTVDYFLGDIITESLPAIVYSTYNGDLGLLKQAIENTEINGYVRSALLTVYAQLYLDEKVSRQDLTDFLRKLIKVEAYQIENTFTTEIIGIIADTNLFEMMGDVQTLYDQDRINLQMFGDYDDFFDDLYQNEPMDERCYYITDVEKEISVWEKFEKTEKQQEQEEALQKKQAARLEKQVQREKRQNISHKIDRNGPCPCGSGKKYKKCCMKNDEAARHGQPPYETSLDKKEAFATYPAVEELEKSYDRQAIEIDRSVYLALHQRISAMLLGQNEELYRLIKGYNLMSAFDQFQKKVNEEKIQSFSDYDKKYRLHYKSRDWVNEWLVYLNSDQDFLEDEAEIEESKEEVGQMIKQLDQ